MENNFHEFRKNKKLKIQNNFVFFDVESNSKKINKQELLSFKMCCSIFWNKDLNSIKKKTYFNINKFWIDIENSFSKDYKNLIMFAHNTQFDFKQLDGFNQLLSKNWKLMNFYIRNRVFILVFEKQITNKLKYTLHIYDTMNYVNKSLEKLGKSIGLEKLKIDFNKSTISELHIYCKRDTKIIFQFIKRLIEYLEINDLSRLKATAGSLSLNIYRHKFYNPKENIIYIHDWKKAIKLERNSYKGGITDNFQIGSFKEVFKLDINSEYPKVMKDEYLPTKLLFYSHESQYSQKKLFTIFNKLLPKKEYGIIASVLIKLPKKYAYILHRTNKKCLFTYGIFKIALCEPELKYVLKYGQILKIYELAVYKMYPLFKTFITFFHNERVIAKKQKNGTTIEFDKLIMNTQYGKYGQKEILYKELHLNDKFVKQYSEIIKIMLNNKKELLKNNFIVYLGKIINESEIYVINNKLYRLKQLEQNSKDSFVAISSFITSYARMLLIKYLFIAKRENVYYSDTDSLFTNIKGYYNLKKAGCIHKYDLGKLKIEGIDDCTFYAPKFYDFGNLRKCKGIKDDSILENENKDKAVYKVYLWKKIKSDLKDGSINIQEINESTKTVSKLYDKGKVDKLGIVKPYSINELKAMSYAM